MHILVKCANIKLKQKRLCDAHKCILVKCKDIKLKTWRCTWKRLAHAQWHAIACQFKSHLDFNDTRNCLKTTGDYGVAWWWWWPCSLWWFMLMVYDGLWWWKEWTWDYDGLHCLKRDTCQPPASPVGCTWPSSSWPWWWRRCCWWWWRRVDCTWPSSSWLRWWYWWWWLRWWWLRW